jgi:hypothetical protein
MIRESRDGDGPAMLAEHRALVDALRAPGAYDHPVDTVEVIETHISTVLLAGAYAYKLKKPVNLGFVDFSTAARRRYFCEEELRLNRRTAPRLYLAVVAVVRTADGQVRFASGGPAGDDAALDHAVQMRRFADAALFDRLARAGRLTRDDIDLLARALGAFHAALPPAPPGSLYGTPAHVGQRMDQTLSSAGARAGGHAARGPERHGMRGAATRAGSPGVQPGGGRDTGHAPRGNARRGRHRTRPVYRAGSHAHQASAPAPGVDLRLVRIGQDDRLPIAAGTARRRAPALGRRAQAPARRHPK